MKRCVNRTLRRHNATMKRIEWIPCRLAVACTVLMCGLLACADRDLPDDEATVVDYNIAASFRTLCDEIGEDPAIIAHRYALGMDNVDTVVLGVKNRTELDDCLKAADQGPLSVELTDKIDALGIVTV